MAEVLFILTTVFVAYVIFVVVECEKRKKEEAKQSVKAGMKKTVAEVKTQAAATKPAVAAKPAEKKTASAPKPTPAPKPAPAAKATKPAAPEENTVKNPETGEVVKIANNYRFIKRWIKEALVNEGLLDKIYKNNELDDAATAKIQEALDKLKAMEKYQ